MSPENMLRRALEAQAQRIEIRPDALGSIRARIDRRTRQRRRMTMSLASVATGAVATVTAVVIGVTSCVPPQPLPTAPPAASGTSAPASPTPPASTPAPGTVRLPVYYLGSAGNRTVLYREFHTRGLPVDSLTNRIVVALTQMLRGEPHDPDYVSGWPAGATVRGVRLEGTVVVVDLAGAAANSVGSETAELTVAQLVWTVTAVAADFGTPLDGVRLLIDGSAVSELWGHVATGGILRRGGALPTLAPVWLISPQHGDTVASTFRVHIDGAVFEATAQLRVRDPGGGIVDERVVTLDEGGPGRGEAFVELSLPAGRYTLEAFYFSPEDGSVQAVDDHDIAVG